MNEFYVFLDSFINTHEATTSETKDRKDGIIMNFVKLIYGKNFNTYKTKCDNEKVKVKEKTGRDYKQFQIIDNKKQKSE